MQISGGSGVVSRAAADSNRMERQRMPQESATLYSYEAPVQTRRRLARITIESLEGATWEGAFRLFVSCRTECEGYLVVTVGTWEERIPLDEGVQTQVVTIPGSAPEGREAVRVRFLIAKSNLLRPWATDSRMKWVSDETWALQAVAPIEEDRVEERLHQSTTAGIAPDTEPGLMPKRRQPPPVETLLAEWRTRAADESEETERPSPFAAFMPTATEDETAADSAAVDGVEAGAEQDVVPEEAVTPEETVGIEERVTEVPGAEKAATEVTEADETSTEAAEAEEAATEEAGLEETTTEEAVILEQESLAETGSPADEENAREVDRATEEEPSDTAGVAEHPETEPEPLFTATPFAVEPESTEELSRTIEMGDAESSSSLFGIEEEPLETPEAESTLAESAELFESVDAEIEPVSEDPPERLEDLEPGPVSGDGPIFAEAESSPFELLKELETDRSEQETPDGSSFGTASGATEEPGERIEALDEIDESVEPEPRIERIDLEIEAETIEVESAVDEATIEAPEEESALRIRLSELREAIEDAEVEIDRIDELLRTEMSGLREKLRGLSAELRSM